ncbi:hypothetical protein SDC9_164679 [bioreactor metagenome]|uniref:Uncharacterized protein n=1 Tax=bioreactor metagenome TaxID=1076179 RepID=A0A645FU85_9ZZZZ
MVDRLGTELTVLRTHPRAGTDNAAHVHFLTGKAVSNFIGISGQQRNVDSLDRGKC